MKKMCQRGKRWLAFILAVSVMVSDPAVVTMAEAEIVAVDRSEKMVKSGLANSEREEVLEADLPDSEGEKVVEINLPDSERKEMMEAGSDILERMEVKVIKFPVICLQYRVWQPDSFDFLREIEFDSDMEQQETMAEQLYEAMGSVRVVEEGKCAFDGVRYDETGDECYVETAESRYIFEKDTYTICGGSPLFEYVCISETIQDQSIPSRIRITQGADRRGRSNRGWCDSRFLAAEWRDNAGYSDAYHSIVFRECGDVSSWEELAKKDLRKENGKSGDVRLEIGLVTKETYYEILFTNEEEGWSYSTVAAIIRVIPEKQFDENADYPGTVNGYPVITFGYDETAPEVVFAEEALNRREDSDEITEIGEYITEIAFEVCNQGFEVDSLEYAFVAVTGEETITAEMIRGLPADFTVLLPKEGAQYKVECPDTEGDYVLCVKTRNLAGAETEYISNCFFVDRTAPDIIFSYEPKRAVGKETAYADESAGSGKDLTHVIENGEVIYVSYAVHGSYEIREAHLRDVTVSITATELDKTGEKKEISSLAEPLEKKSGVLADVLKRNQKAECDFSESGNYTVTITAVDQAGLKRSITHHFTVDGERPDRGAILAVGSFHERRFNEDGKAEWTLTQIRKEWREWLEDIKYQIFSQEEIEVTLDGADRISPVTIYYYAADKQLTEQELGELDEDSWTEYVVPEGEQMAIRLNRKAVLYEKVRDMAGNISYFCSDGMITDGQAPEITLRVENEANRNGFYHGDISFSAYIEDKIVEGGNGNAGLQYIAYRIGAEGKETEERILYDGNGSGDPGPADYALDQAMIPAERFNSNRVVLSLTAVDQAGNRKELSREFCIDTVKPEIFVSYDDEAEGEYYNRARTATITIKERNLDTRDVTITAKGANGARVSVGEWRHSANIGISDEAVYTCKVIFSEEDDYQFTVSCTDLAGNKAKKTFTDHFTIDRTEPVIMVEYSGNIAGTFVNRMAASMNQVDREERKEPHQYYSGEVTAVITIVEHNFKESLVSIKGGVGDAQDSVGRETADWSMTDFTSNGDIHTATVRYLVDGTYTLQIACVDKAGNTAEMYSGSSFTIDLKSPEIEISGIEDQSANKGDVRPVITCTDTNYAWGQAVLTVTGVNGGEIDLEQLGYKVEDRTDGQQFTLNFPKNEKLDDVYTLSVEVTDKAGNIAQGRIQFSVNRYGSVYTLAQECREWLTSGECAYIKEAKPVVIIETNVDRVVERNISVMAGGRNAAATDIRELGECSADEREKGVYYEIHETNARDQWYQYRYEIHAGNFAEEGKYTVQIDSTDQAGNHTSSAGDRRGGSPLQVQFAVDRTAPSVVVSGADDGGIYNEDAYTIWLDVQDNLAMDSVTVYLNGSEYGSYPREELEELEDGRIPVVVKEALSVQRLQVEARDMAGNVLSEKAAGAYDAVFEDFTILVTRNAFVRFLHTTWLMIGAVFVIVCGIVGIVFRNVAQTNKKRK